MYAISLPHKNLVAIQIEAISIVVINDNSAIPITFNPFSQLIFSAYDSLMNHLYLLVGYSCPNQWFSTWMMYFD